MKLAKVIILITIVLMFLTGCTNAVYQVTINNDGSANLEYIIGLNKKEYANMGGNAEEVVDDNLKEYKQIAKENNYTIEDYSDTNIIGFIASKYVEDITSEKLFSNIYGSQNIKIENEKISKTNGFLKKEYMQNAKVDLTNIPTDISGVIIKYRVVTSGKVIKHNAKNVYEKGKTLEWELEPGKVNEINFVLKNSNYIIMIIVGFIVLNLSIVWIADIYKSRKKYKIKEAKKNSNPDYKPD